MIKLLLAYSLAQSFLDKSFMTAGILKSVALAVFTWWLCGFSMWLWNRRFQMRLIHHLLCAFAAAVTLVSVFLFQCLGDVKSNALRDLKHWQEDYLADRHFEWLTFVQVSESLQQLYRQKGWDWDAHKYPFPPHEVPPDSGRYQVPLDKQEAREISLRIYGDRTIEHLRTGQPVLSQILWKDSQIPIDAMLKDLADFQRNNAGGVYNYTTGSLRIAGELCLKKLGREVAKQVLFLRLGLIATFLVAQFSAFGFAGYSAYSDLKINR